MARRRGQLPVFLVLTDLGLEILLSYLHQYVRKVFSFGSKACDSTPYRLQIYTVQCLSRFPIRLYYVKDSHLSILLPSGTLRRTVLQVIYNRSYNVLSFHITGTEFPYCLFW